MRSEQEAARAIARYGDTVQRLCTVHLKNQADTEDIFQTVFLKYVLHERDFADEEHEKAWFIRVTINACRDLLRSLFRRSTVPLDEAACLPAPPPAEHREVLEAVLALPPRQRAAVHLHYYEGYSTEEIAAILGQRPGTVRSHLSRARQALREQLEGEI